MTEQKPTITFHVEEPTDVSPDALYAVLSDLSTHIDWAGKNSPNKGFHLLTLDAPGGEATKGTTFSSSGINMNKGMTFHDTSTVVVAEPGRRFGFDTESTLERRHVKNWYVHFEHRYTIEPIPGGSKITYECRAFPKNYKPWWLKPGMKPGTRMNVNRMHRKHMQNLIGLAQRARV
jgi:hypothetical protein